MQLRFRVGGPQSTQLSTRPRGLGFLYSLALHGAIFALLLSPVAQTPDANDVYTELVSTHEKEHKLIWYKFKEQLPAVSPTNPTTDSEANQKFPQKARQPIVTAPQADPGKQLVWVPTPQMQLKVDLSSPNLIALRPSLPTPEKPQAKSFVSPERPRPQQPTPPTALPNAPELTTKPQQNTALEALLKKTAAPRREFTPPTQPKAPTPSPAAALPAAPSLEASQGTSGIDPVLNTPMAPPRRDFTPPPVPSSGTAQAGNGTAPALPAAPAIDTAHGPAGVSVAILGLNPTNAPQIPTPEGSRSAHIAAGPDTGPGEPQLAKGNSPLALPDVSIQGRRGSASGAATGSKPPADKPGLGTAPMPALQATATIQTTPHLSVPMWPSSRTLPLFVERRFHARVVFTTVLPAAQNGADWVVWFAENVPMPSPDTRLLMRPPTLMRGDPLPPVPVRENHGTGKLLVAGILRKDGHFGCEASDAVAQDLLDTLQSWQFNPAMRNGVPVDVEAVLEIPLVYTAANLTAPK
jgi:hypothetical protein